MMLELARPIPVVPPVVRVLAACLILALLGLPGCSDHDDRPVNGTGAAGRIGSSAASPSEPLTEKAPVECSPDIEPQPIRGRWPIGPTVGGVTSTAATLWLRTEKLQAVDFRCSCFPDLCGSETSSAFETSADMDFTARVRIENLDPDTRYYYTPRVNGFDIFRGGYASFLTAPAEGEATEFSFIVLTDFQSARAKGSGPTFESAARSNPAFAIIGGDLDHRDPARPTKGLERIRESIRTMHRENLDWTMERRRALAGWTLRRMGITHLWDDHDFCCNDPDGTFVGKGEALSAHDDNFVSYPRAHPGDGIYQTWSWGQVQFFLLDGR